MNPPIKNFIASFIEEIRNNRVEIYNEFSLQHELGIFLRKRLPDHKVQFERNISYFDIPKEASPKKEIDITIFNKEENDYLATIELKFLNNGQYPMAMFQICKDVAFMEHTTNHKFQFGYVLVIVDDPLFYRGGKDTNDKVPYCYFRSGRSLTGKIKGQVGKNKYEINLRGAYNVIWEEISDPRKYTLIEIT